MKMLAVIIICLLAAVLLPAFCLGQGTLRITFDGPPIQPTNSQYLIQSYSEAGFSFTPLPGSDGFLRNGGGLYPVYPYDGSAYLQAGFGEGLEFSNGGLFGLSSVDLAGHSYLLTNFTVDFVGYHADGSTVTTSFSGTGIGFQTYVFPSDWSSGLTRVEIPDAPWSLDNLVVTVPEPTLGSLSAIAAVMFTFYKLRRERKL